MSSTPMQRAVWTYIIAAALAFWLLACGAETIPVTIDDRAGGHAELVADTITAAETGVRR